MPSIPLDLPLTNNVNSCRSPDTNLGRRRQSGASNLDYSCGKEPESSDEETKIDDSGDSDLETTLEPASVISLIPLDLPPTNNVDSCRSPDTNLGRRRQSGASNLDYSCGKEPESSDEETDIDDSDDSDLETTLEPASNISLRARKTQKEITALAQTYFTSASPFLLRMSKKKKKNVLHRTPDVCSLKEYCCL
jgi:hypothetical protein